MLITITDPNILAQYPHLAPPKTRMIDMVVGEGGIYEMDPGTPEAGVGRLVQFSICSTYLRNGEPHTATDPVPHTAYDMLHVIEPEIAE